MYAHVRLFVVVWVFIPVCPFVLLSVNVNCTLVLFKTFTHEPNFITVLCCESVSPFGTRPTSSYQVTFARRVRQTLRHFSVLASLVVVGINTLFVQVICKGACLAAVARHVQWLCIICDTRRFPCQWLHYRL